MGSMLRVLTGFAGVCGGPRLSRPFSLRQLEDELHKWVKDMSVTNPQERPPVSMGQVLEKAQETALMKGVQDFKATHIWFGSFVKRYGLDRLGLRVEDNKAPVVGAPPQEMEHPAPA